MKRQSILVLAVVLTLALTQAVRAGSSFPICVNSANQSDPVISGSWVVWEDNRNGPHADIYTRNLSTGQMFPVYVNTERTQDGPSISGDIVVWQDFRNSNYDIYGYNLTSQTPITVCTNSSIQSRPAISGDIVVWLDKRNGNWDIYGKRLSGGSDFAVYTVGTWLDRPAVENDIVVWEGNQNGAQDILAYDLSTGNVFDICTASSMQASPAISGNTVVWKDYRNGNWDIYAYDLSSKTEFLVSNTNSFSGDPDISGNFIVWGDSGNIYGYDISVQTVFTVFDGPWRCGVPAISGNIVVWEDWRNGNSDIYGTIIPAPTNTAPVANAGPDQTVEQTSTVGANVQLDGSGSSDPDGDPLTYDWAWTGGTASGVNPTVQLPPGLTTITLIVSDGELSDTDTVNINVIDTTPPEVFCPENITLKATEPSGVPISNPEIQAWLLSLYATDLCDPEPELSNDAPSLFPPGTTTVTFMATDDSGNSSTCQATMTVIVDMTIDILDDTLTPKTKWIKCQIWPPDGYSYADIDIESILLEREIPVSSYSFNERKQKLVVKFRASGLNLEPSPDPLDLTVSGELINGTVFEGSDFVTVVSKSGKKK